MSSNRTLSDVSLALTKRKPFDCLAERPFLKDGRGGWPDFERGRQALERFLAHFGGPPEPFVITAERILRCSE